MQEIAGNRKDWVILIFLSLVWGCSFILIKKALITFDAPTVGAMRIAIGSVAFAPFVYHFRKEIDWSQWKKFLLVGLTGSGIPSFLFAFAQTEITSSMAGLLNSMTPIWTLLLGIFLFKLRFNHLKMVGVLLGFIGAVIIIIAAHNSKFGGNPMYGFLAIIATVCYALSVNMVQGFFGKTKPIIISAMSFFLIGPPIWIFLMFTGVKEQYLNNDFAIYSLSSVVALSLFGTVMASILFYILVQRTSAVFGSMVTYLMPFVVIIWGLIDGEIITMLQLLGMGTILIGVYFTKKY